MSGKESAIKAALLKFLARFGETTAKPAIYYDMENRDPTVPDVLVIKPDGTEKFYYAHPPYQPITYTEDVNGLPFTLKI